MKKRLSAVMAFTFIFFSFIFSGCMNFNTDNPSSCTRTVRVNVISTDGTEFTTQSARTIISASQPLSAYDFYFEGTSNSGSPIDFQKITVSSDGSTKKGTFKYNFEPYFYRLNMYAVPAGTQAADVHSSYRLKASVAVDLSAADEINFYLSAYGISGMGGYELSIYAENNWFSEFSSGYSAKAQILNQSSGAVLRESMLGIFNGTPTVNFSSTGNPPEYNLSAGTYDFKVIFTNSENNAVFTYNDDIVIYTNQLTKSDIKIPRIIQDAPSAPDYLIARYSDTSSYDALIYPVQFCWNDTSYNENYYELQIFDITPLCNWDERSVPSAYTDNVTALIDSFSSGTSSYSQAELDDMWNNLINELSSANNKKFTTKENNNLLLDGSLDTDCTYAVVNLLYGNCYLARIRSVTDTGLTSDFTYLDLKNKGSKSFDSVSSDFAPQFTPADFDSDCSAISRYKVFYDLCSGVYYDSSFQNVTAEVLPLRPALIYTSQKRNSSLAIQNPTGVVYSGADTADLCYFDNSEYHVWQRWNKDSMFGNAYSVTEYAGCANLYLYAYYGEIEIETGSFVLRTSSTMDATEADIVVSANPAGSQDNPQALNGEAVLELADNGSVEISKSTYRYANFLFNVQRNEGCSITFEYGLKGGKVYSVPVKTDSNYNFYAFNYAQIELTDLSVGAEYYVYYTIEHNGSFYKYAVSFTVTD